MSLEINTVVLGGNLTRDVELKEIPGGAKVGTFGLATNRTYVRNGEKVQETSFFDIEVWGPQAENCAKYLEKGRPVVVTGRMKQDRWENEGQNRSKIKVVANSVQFLPSRGRSGEQQSVNESSDAAWGA